MAEHLPGTTLLTSQGDLAAQMVAGIDRWLLREAAASRSRRAAHWCRDLSSPAAYAASVEPNRERLRRLLGAGDERLPTAFEIVSPADRPGEPLAVGEGFQVHEVRWPVRRQVTGEGLLLVPEAPPVADVIALPDCAVLPEELVGLRGHLPPAEQYARRLAEAGCRVVVPVLADRGTAWSGWPGVRHHAISHREFIYRAAYQMGHHPIGFDIDLVDAAVEACDDDRPVGVVGWGEGGLIALLAAALNQRLAAALVAGHFQPRESLWEEPIDRNVWALLTEFGDAEVATLVAPRTLVVEACRGPEVIGRTPSTTRQGPTPGDIRTPPLAEVRDEVERARGLVAGLTPRAWLELVGEGSGAPGSTVALAAFLDALAGVEPRPLGALPRANRPLPHAPDRMRRQVEGLIGHTQHLVELGPRRREAFWKRADATGVETFVDSTVWYRDYFWREVIGQLPPPTEPPNPRSRLRYEGPTYRVWDVVLDLYPDVFCCGLLVLPNDLRPGEQRPVVVCQHGLEGRAERAALPDEHDAYRAWGVRLAERGFVVFSPQNPYVGYDAFRALQRKANPLKLSLFSFITRQHERILEWLGQQPFVDRERIGFYGISYGGKTAMRVPALLPGYCLSICSADYDDWIRKNASVAFPASYLYTNEYEMFEFDLGNTFNYGELSWLIFPRPFMVERGHHDGVAPDEWVGYEFARTYRRYNLLGLGDRAEIEYFNGPHAINGVGTFAFLHRWLRWPEPGAVAEPPQP